MIPPIGIVGIPIWRLDCCGLNCPIVFAHSDIKSFTAGVREHCSVGCTGDGKFVQVLDCQSLHALHGAVCLQAPLPS